MAVGFYKFADSKSHQEVGKDYILPTYKRYYPTYFSPTLDLFPVRADAWGEDLAKSVRRSFALYWSDRRSAANALRRALEVLMDQQQITGSSLHDKINAYAGLHLDASALADALRYIGNHGSHGNGPLTHEDMQTAYEILEGVLNYAFPDDKDQQLLQKAQKINQEKKPPSQH
jgi:hypothetical protein